jgi:hypothetical protein
MNSPWLDGLLPLLPQDDEEEDVQQDADAEHRGEVGDDGIVDVGRAHAVVGVHHVFHVHHAVQPEAQCGVDEGEQHDDARGFMPCFHCNDRVCG